MQRDTQKQKVYDAERCLQTNGGMEWAEVEAFVKKVTTSKFVQRKFKTKRVITAVKTHSGGRASGGGYRFDRYWDEWRYQGPHIALGVWARQPVVILHELAHHYAGFSQQHNWKFCEVELILVRHFMGKEAHDTLKASFRAHRVRFTKPRAKRVLTEEQKQVLRDRLAAAKAAKAAEQAEQAA